MAITAYIKWNGTVKDLMNVIFDFISSKKGKDLGLKMTDLYACRYVFKFSKEDRENVKSGAIVALMHSELYKALTEEYLGFVIGKYRVETNFKPSEGEVYALKIRLPKGASSRKVGDMYRDILDELIEKRCIQSNSHTVFEDEFDTTRGEQVKQLVITFSRHVYRHLIISIKNLLEQFPLKVNGKLFLLHAEWCDRETLVDVNRDFHVLPSSSLEVAK
jgi:hypothetical protein